MKRAFHLSILYFVVLIAWMFLLLWVKPIAELKYYVLERQTVGNDAEKIKIFENETIRQTFVLEEPCNVLEIYMENVSSTYKGQFVVRLYDFEMSLVKEWGMDKFDLDGGYTAFKVGEFLDINKQYTVEIAAPDLTEKNAIIVSINDASEKQTQHFKQNGRTVLGKELPIAVYKEYPNFFAYAALVIFVVTVIAYLRYKYAPIERSSLLVMAGMGACMLLIMAPSSAPDDRTHYWAALELSNIIMGKPDVGKFERDYLDFHDIVLHRNANSAFVRVLRDEAFRNDSGTCYLYNNSSSLLNLYHPIEYLMPALGITLGRIFNLGFIYTHYIGRLFNLIMYTAMAMTAIKLIPRNKELILLVSILPMSLQQASSYSYDVLLNGVSLIMVAYICRIICNRENFDWRKAAIITVLGGGIAPVKIVYILMLMLAWAIPPECFKSKKDKYIKFFAIVVGTILILLASQYAAIIRLFTESKAAENKIVLNYTVSFLLEHPARFLKIFISSSLNNAFTWVKQGIGSVMAGLTLGIPDYLITGFFILLLLCASSSGYEDAVIDAKAKKVFAAVGIAGSALVICAAFLWTSYGSKGIAGVQGRYFIPYFPVLLLSIGTNKFQLNLERKNLIYGYWFLQIGVIINVINQVSY